MFRERDVDPRYPSITDRILLIQKLFISIVRSILCKKMHVFIIVGGIREGRGDILPTATEQKSNPVRGHSVTATNVKTSRLSFASILYRRALGSLPRSLVGLAAPTFLRYNT